MRAWQQVLGFGLLAAGLPVLAADHREAPAVNERNPLSEPDFAGSYAFSPDVLYRFTIDNTGDAIPENRIDIVFSKPSTPGVQRFRARFPGGIVVRGRATPPNRPDNPVVIEDEDNDIFAFAGPRDDPFFFDAVGFNRFVASGDPGAFRGINSFGDLNVSAIVLAFPPELVSDGETDLEISGFTFPRAGRSFRPAGRAIDRTGNPAVSTVFIPFALRDRFNRARPQNDADNFGEIIADRLTELGTSADNITALAGVAIPDTLKLDLTAPVEFPNGRALEDDVIDTLFGLIFNGGPPTGDGVDNDSVFLDEFPFLGPPLQPL
ncbi:MAG: hypothetical protein K0S35_3858 [Geminicoccaceae bacterium]|nr:hypothetical protein [Geminicoccaceae bacterium]